MKPKTVLRNFLLGFALLSTSTAFAATLTWDNGGTTGNWNTNDLNWTGSAWNNATPDDAVFGATGVGTVTLSEAITAGSITFGTAGYTVDTSTFGLTLNTGITANESAGIVGATALTLGANTLCSVAATQTLAASLEIGGAFGITKTGDGTLDLSGANTYSGGTTISAGTVTFGSATALGTGALTFDNAGTATSTAVFSIAGTHTNAINVAAGSTSANTIQTTNATGNVILNGAVTINAGTTLKLDNSGSVLDFGTGVISGNGSLETTGTSTGNLIIRGDNTYSGSTLLSGASIHVPALGTTGPEGSPTSGPFGTGALTINNASMRSTTIADTLIGNPVALSGNLTAITNSSEKNLIFAGPVTLAGTRTITSAVGQTVAGTSLIISGAIGDEGNDFGLIKEGGGNLTLSGANSYTGDTTLSAGRINANTGSAFGTGDILVTGSSRINVVNGQTYANNLTVNSGQTLTMQVPTSANNVNVTATFTGALTGSGNLFLPNAGNNGAQGILHFTNTENTFTGNVNLSASGAGDEHFRFASLGDGGTFTFAKNGNRQLISHSGASNIAFNTRTITIATTMVNGGTTDRQGMDGGGSNPVSMFANDGVGTVSFTQNMVVNNFTSTYGVLYFGGTNTGNNTFGGNIGDTSNATSKLAIGKFGSGKWILSGSNTYEGDTLIAGGTLSVGSIDVAANAQPLGKGATIQLGVGGSSSNIGTLEYTGGTGSTNKQIRIGTPLSAASTAAGSILNNGSGALTFTNSTFNPTSTSYTHPHTGVVVGLNVTATRTLTLGGSYTSGINEIQGVIQNNAAAGLVGLTKTGNSTWQLSGDNTNTGTTAIQGGVLLANHVNAIAGGLAFGGTGAAITLTGGGILGLGAGDFTRLPSGGTLTAGRIAFLDNGGFAAYGADRIVNFGGSSGIVAIGSTATPNIGNLNGKTLILGSSTATHKVTVTNTLDFGGASRTIQVNNGAAAVDAEISGVIQPQSGAATAGFTKTGTGTLLLSNNNTYTGGTTVSAGTLTLNGSLADATMSIATGATVNCTATGTLTFNVDGITADQVVNDGTFNLGGLTVAVNATGAGLTESEYILVDATGGGTISGTFAGVTSAPGYTLDYGTPNQVKLVGGAPSDPYNAWAGGPGLPFDGDANGDGVSNGLAWLLGAADKDVSALNKLPTVSQSGGDLVLTFTCLKLANRGTASLTLQYSKDLGISDPWTSNEVSVPDAAGSEGAVTFTVPSVNPDSDLVNLQATIPASEAAPGTKLFGRLKAVKP